MGSCGFSKGCGIWAALTGGDCAMTGVSVAGAVEVAGV